MLTPLDIESKNFSKTISGYSVREVKQFMKEVLLNYEKLYKENIELKDKINVLHEGIQYYKTIEETLQNTLLLAEKTAEETKGVARQKAEQIIKEAELKAEVMINEAKNEVYKIHQTKEEMVKNYDSTKIQVIQILRTQLELMERGELDIHSNLSTIEKFKNDTITEEEISSNEQLAKDEVASSSEE